jgi:hypothetical protein
MFIMLNISSKQELPEPHGFTAPAPPDDVALCGSKVDFTKFIKSLFFNVPFCFGSDPDPD